jgi:hypothetical protein
VVSGEHLPGEAQGLRFGSRAPALAVPSVLSLRPGRHGLQGPVDPGRSLHNCGRHDHNCGLRLSGGLRELEAWVVQEQEGVVL